MIFRKTALERLDEDVLSALVALDEIDAADRRLSASIDRLRLLDDRLRRLQAGEMRALRELERLGRVTWVAIYNSVLGTMEDLQRVEMASLLRVQAELEETQRERSRLQRLIQMLLGRSLLRREAERHRELMLARKAAWLMQNDPATAARLRELEDEARELARRSADLGHKLTAWQGGHGREWQGSEAMKFLRRELDQAEARASAIAAERESLLLDGVRPLPLRRAG